jgi:hypothetical protein
MLGERGRAAEDLARSGLPPAVLHVAGQVALERRAAR